MEEKERRMEQTIFAVRRVQLPESLEQTTYQILRDDGSRKVRVQEVLSPTASICIASWRWDVALPIADDIISQNLLGILSLFKNSNYNWLLIDILSLPQTFYGEAEPSIELLTLFTRLYSVLPVMFGVSAGLSTIDEQINRAWLSLELYHATIQNPNLMNIRSLLGETATISSVAKFVSDVTGVDTFNFISERLVKEGFNVTDSRRHRDLVKTTEEAFDFDLAQRLTEPVLPSLVGFMRGCDPNKTPHALMAGCLFNLMGADSVPNFIPRYFRIHSNAINVSRVDDLGKICAMIYGLRGYKAESNHDLIQVIDKYRLSGAVVEIMVAFCHARDLRKEKDTNLTIPTDLDLEKMVRFMRSTERVLKVVKPRGFENVTVIAGPNKIAISMRLMKADYVIWYEKATKNVVFENRVGFDLDILANSALLFRDSYEALKVDTFSTVCL